jgi:hypothetical protein
MNRKPDTKKAVEKEIPGALSAGRLRKLMDRLEERPELLAQVEAIVSLAANDSVEGPLRRADEVETRVVEATRQLGRQTMEAWGQEAQERAVADCRAEHPQARIKKKAR